jgi:Ca2+-transporting ATPase
MLVDAVNDETLKILLFAAAISLAIGIATEGLAHGWYEGGAIFAAVFVITVVTVFNGYMQERQFQNLFRKSNEKEVNVIRGGKQIGLSQWLLVTGDILRVESGLIMPVDAILLKKNGKNIFLTPKRYHFMR